MSDKTLITQNCIVLSISKHYLGETKSVKSDRIRVDADSTWLKASKALFSSEAYDKIISGDHRLMNKIDAYCLPAPFSRGNYLVPIKFVPDVDKLLQDYSIERKELVDTFIEDYQIAIEKARDHLGELYNDDDYPPQDVAKSRFKFQWQYLDFGVSPKLEEISKDLFLREQQKMEQQWKEATAEVQLLLRQNLADLIEHLVDKLTPTADGKQKSFRSSSLENIQNFLETFEAKNVTNDQELQSLVNRMKQLTNGINADNIRSSDTAREFAKTNFERAKQALDGMIVTGKLRMVELEDDAA